MCLIMPHVRGLCALHQVHVELIATPKDLIDLEGMTRSG